MKKVIALFVVLIMLSCGSLAVCEDYDTFSDEQLIAMLNSARFELLKRNAKQDKMVLLDLEGVFVYLTGKVETSDSNVLKMEAVIANNTKNAFYAFSKAYLNGWKCGSFDTGLPPHSNGMILPGTKQKGTIYFNPADTDLTDWNEATDMSLLFSVYDIEDNLILESELMTYPLSIDLKHNSVSIKD